MKNWPHIIDLAKIFKLPEDVYVNKHFSDKDPYVVAWWAEEDCGIFSADEDKLVEFIQYELLNEHLPTYIILDKELKQRYLSIKTIKVI